MKHLNICVYGKVQGVHYRQSTLATAKQLGVNGLVHNESDGSVYIEAEGEEDQLRKLLEWCSKGPPLAVVSDIKYAEGPVVMFSGFSITR